MLLAAWHVRAFPTWRAGRSTGVSGGFRGLLPAIFPRNAPSILSRDESGETPETPETPDHGTTSTFHKATPFGVSPALTSRRSPTTRLE